MIIPDELYAIFRNYPLISTDSRNTPAGSIFFAIRGENFDGNRFAKDALDNGAAFAVIDNPEYHYGSRTLLAEDSLLALQQLAVRHRELINARIIGITGSNGKTTTKELIGRVLASQYNTVVTRGNLNNHIGVPLTLLSIGNETEFAVIEMGANHPGEIAALCRMAKPGYGIITNIGKAHLEGFGGFDGVIRAKSELYDFIRNNQGTVFLNRDNSLLLKLAEGLNIITYGKAEDSECIGTITGRDPYLDIRYTYGAGSGEINSMLPGDYNFENILAGVCAGLYFNIDADRIKSAIESYVPENNRSQWVKTGRNLVLLDAYNANPSSMKAALENFHHIETPGKVVILGDMMELGVHSLDEHREIALLAESFNFYKLILVGENFSRAAKGINALCFHTLEDARAWLAENPMNNCSVLLKGSRKMQLESMAKLF